MHLVTTLNMLKHGRLVFLIYSLENRSFVHLEFTHPYTRDYFKNIKQEFSRVSSHSRNGAKKHHTRNNNAQAGNSRVLAIWFIINYWENYSLPPNNNLSSNGILLILHSRVVSFWENIQGLLHWKSKSSISYLLKQIQSKSTSFKVALTGKVETWTPPTFD